MTNSQPIVQNEGWMVYSLHLHDIYTHTYYYSFALPFFAT